MSEFRKHREDAENDIKAAHKSLSMAISSSDVDDWEDSHVEDMHTALIKLNEIKKLFK